VWIQPHANSQVIAATGPTHESGLLLAGVVPLREPPSTNGKA
jgi:hypothetical protein